MRYISYRERDEKRNRNKLTLIPLLFASVLLVAGTYAWFTYFSDVDSTMTGHVVAWNIDFDGDKSLSDEFSVTVEKIYPGMDDFSSELKITNSGETSAEISSVLKSITILGTTYQVGQTYEGEVLTSTKIIEILEEKYPFKFSFDVVKPVIASGEDTNFVVGLKWDFETYKKVADTDTYSDIKEYYILNGEKYESVEIPDADTFTTKKDTLYYANDADDTYWGEEAYDFISDNPSTPCVTLTLQVNAVQHLDTE